MGLNPNFSLRILSATTVWILVSPSIWTKVKYICTHLLPPHLSQFYGYCPCVGNVTIFFSFFDFCLRDGSVTTFFRFEVQKFCRLESQNFCRFDQHKPSFFFAKTRILQICAFVNLTPTIKFGKNLKNLQIWVLEILQIWGS